MRWLAKNLILTTAVVSAIFIVDLSSVGAATLPKFYHTEKIICPLLTDSSINYIDFWGKFRDTVMPDKPQNNNPPKEMKKPPPNKSDDGKSKPNH